MATLGDLATQVAQLLDANDEERFPTPSRYWCVNAAIRRILRWPGVRFGLQTGDLDQTGLSPPTVSEQGRLTLPTNWIRGVRICYRESEAAELVDLGNPALYADFRAAYPNLDTEDPGQPELYTYYGAEILFGPPPVEGATWVVDYYGLLVDLYVGVDHNIVTDNAPDAALFGALVEAVAYLPGEEARVGQWEARFSDLCDGLAVETTRNAMGARTGQRRIPGR